MDDSQAEQKVEQAMEKGKAEEREYLNAVTHANELFAEVFQRHLPPILDVRLLRRLLARQANLYVLDMSCKPSSLSAWAA